jgi:hypothetical protein
MLPVTLSIALALGATPVDFDTGVMPVLTKAGCNAGACHGAAAGRGGFKLSLYGGAPAADYAAIVHEVEGRRINLARPSASLLLAKPTERLEHGGGHVLEVDGTGARLIERWIAQGATRSKARTLSRLEVSPAQAILRQTGAEARLSCTARYADGTTTDVTAWTVFTAEDPAAVKIEEGQQGAVARVLRRGQHTVIARFLERVVPIRLIVPLADVPVDLAGSPRQNFIDDHVLAMLGTLRIKPSPPAGDAEFLRRLRLDLTGRLPSPDEVRAFAVDHRPGKREELIDRLLASPEFIEYWTYKFAKLLRVQAPGNDRPAGLAYHAWLRRQIADDAPYDRVARTLVLATGDSHVVGPANFHRTVAGPRDEAELVSELFLGARLRCANCHNHPLDRWTQDDYHGLAAIFARLERGRNVRLLQRGEVSHPATGESAVPRLPGTAFISGQQDGRAALAAWLTAKDNPQFARAIVNRLWKGLMGRGLIEPADDLRDTNPATHSELLDRLADDFVAHGYRIRHTLRQIATSAAYARSAATKENAADDRFYSRALAKPLEAEVMADALCDVTGMAERYGNEPPGTRAIALALGDARSEALDVLGRCNRRESCEGGESPPGLSQKLHFLNGGLINAKITASEGRLRQLLGAGKSNEEIVREFYLRALAREPREAEQAHWRKRLSAEEPGRRQALEDFVWAVLNSREFATNH